MEQRLKTLLHFCLQAGLSVLPKYWLGTEPQLSKMLEIPRYSVPPV
jgi:hypothetical protein